MRPTKTTLRDRCRMAIAGTDKNLGSTPMLSLDGADRTPAEVKQKLQGFIDASDKTQAARSAWIDAVKDERVKRSETQLLLAALRSVVTMKYGNNATAALGDFGFEPRKRASKTVETKATAIEKAGATRVARNTMGSRQRESVKGNVTGINVTPIVSAPVASQDGAAETPATTTGGPAPSMASTAAPPPTQPPHAS